MPTEAGPTSAYQTVAPRAELSARTRLGSPIFTFNEKSRRTHEKSIRTNEKSRQHPNPPAPGSVHPEISSWLLAIDNPIIRNPTIILKDENETSHEKYLHDEDLYQTLRTTDAQATEAAATSGLQNADLLGFSWRLHEVLLIILEAFQGKQNCLGK